jgi:scyllo-inositol 2-dehydrogenase (NADP+)
MLERNPKPRLELVGLNGTYVKYGYDTPDSASEKYSEKYQEKKLRSEFIDNELKSEYIPIYIGKHYLFYDNLANDINSGNNNEEDKKLALSVIMIMEKALESNKENKGIEIPQVI